MDMISPPPQDVIKVFKENLPTLGLSESGRQDLADSGFEAQVGGEKQALHPQAAHGEINHPFVGHAPTGICVNTRSVAQYLADVFPIPAATDMAVNDHGFRIPL